MVDRNRISVVEICPARLKSLLCIDLAAMCALRGVQRTVQSLSDDVSIEGLLQRGFDLEPVQQFYASARTPVIRKSRWLSAFSGKHWTNKELYDMGYVADPFCSCCPGVVDDLKHRLYFCTHTAELWGELPPRLLSEARADDPLTRLKYDRGIFPSNAKDIPPPASELEYHFEPLDESSSFSFASSDGPVFSDGSCLCPNDRVLARAGCGVVQTDHEGNFLRAVYGLAPRLLGQNSFSGENCAISAALDLASSPLGMWSDCTGVIKYFDHGLAWASDSTRCAGSIWRSISQRHADVSKVCLGIGHVKAHRSDDEADDNVDAVHIKGNRLADEYAKQGASLHPADDDSTLSHRLLRHRIKLVLRHIAACLALWPAPLIHHRRAKRLRAIITAKPVGHFPSDLTWSFGRWRCPVWCGSFSKLPRHPCPRESKVLKEVLGTQRGHRLWAACVVDGTPLLYCKLCGCSSSSKGVGLLKYCQGRAPGTYGTSAGLKRIHKGFHPWKPLRICKPWPVHIQTPLPMPCVPLDEAVGPSASMPRSMPHTRLRHGIRDEIVPRHAAVAVDDSDSQDDDAMKYRK